MVVLSQAVELLGEEVFVHLPPDGAHLLAGDVVDDLSHVEVRPLPRRVRANDVGAPWGGLLIDLDGACVHLHPADSAVIN